MAYGHRTGESGIPFPPLNLKDSVSAVAHLPEYDAERRSPVLADLGPTTMRAAVPIADNRDPRNLWEGAAKRFISKPPVPRPELLLKFKAFVARWIKHNLVPLAPTTDITFESWVESRNYPRWRKDELREVWRKIQSDGVSSKYAEVKSFGKFEHLAEQAKTLRIINSRSDEYKVIVGPIFHAIEKIVFEHPAFIKKIPLPDRPAYIRDLFECITSNPNVSDYTSFETHFVPDMMNACEMQLYKYMTSHLPIGWDRDLAVLVGVNKCVNKFFTLFVEATRMSGEMCTSLGNGFTNLMVGLFAAEEHGATEVVAVVEGDDGLFETNGAKPTTEWFAELGFTIKLESAPLEEASFCGMIFDPVDLINVCDPMEAMLTLGWTTGRYVSLSPRRKLCLLRSKALSMYYQYNGAPVLAALAQSILRLTAGVDLRWALNERSICGWERDNLMSSMKWFANAPEPRHTGLNTRLLVEKKFALTIEHQLMLEEHFAAMQDFKDFDHPLMAVYAPLDWIDYASKYVVVQPPSTLLYSPPLPLVRLTDDPLPIRLDVFNRKRLSR